MLASFIALIQFQDGQNGIAVSAVGIFCYQRDGRRSIGQCDDGSAGEGLLIGCRSDGNGRTRGRDGISVDLQPQSHGKGGICAGGNNGIIFDLIDTVFGQDKFCSAYRVGNGSACLRLRDGKGQGIPCGGRGLFCYVGGTVQIQRYSGAGSPSRPRRDILLYTTEKSFIYQYL